MTVKNLNLLALPALLALASLYPAAPAYWLPAVGSQEGKPGI